MTISRPNWMKKRQYRHRLRAMIKQSGEVTSELAYWIIEGQFFFTRKREINIALIDQCLDVLYPERKEWAYSGKEKIWKKLLERIANEEAMCKSHTNRITKRRQIRRPSLAMIAITLLLVILMIGSTVTYAFGVNWIESFVRWTQEVLHISISVDHSETNSEPIHSDTQVNTGIAGDLDVTLHEVGIHPRLPQWIPDGFHLVEISQHGLASVITSINAYYANNSGQEFFVTLYPLRSSGLESSQNVERSEDNHSYTYIRGQDTYYFVRNLDNYTVSWILPDCWVIINGSLDESVLRKMIDSIYDKQEDI